MGKEDTVFYGAIIAACVIGIVIIAYSVMSGPGYEENFSELYFYGEKLQFENEKSMFLGYDVLIDEGKPYIDEDRTGSYSLGPFIVGSTIVLDGRYWNIEGISEGCEEALMRNFPLSAPQGSYITIGVVISNHENELHSYEWEAATLAEKKEGTKEIDSEKEAIIELTLKLPAIDGSLTLLEEYDEIFSNYTRHVKDYGDMKHITLLNEGMAYAQFWKTKVSFSIDTGNKIHFWIRIDDE